jgi:hypothetical protein
MKESPVSETHYDARSSADLQFVSQRYVNLRAGGCEKRRLTDGSDGMHEANYGRSVPLVRVKLSSGSAGA